MRNAGSLVGILIWVAVFSLSLSQINCASRGRPGGGPVDKTPPYIIGTDPRPDSTGLKSIEEINISFSERMNEGSVQKSIFLSPPLEYEADWSGGDELTLLLKDTLSADQTYVITIGAGATDMRKNRMTDSFQLAFATGDSLDRGEIYGKVFGTKKDEIFYVYAYRDTDPDSLDPKYIKADFLSQTGPDGNFWLRYLPNGFYRIFVIEDLNKNLLLDAATERIGIPTEDIDLDSGSGAAGPLNFVPTRIDTTAPELSGARARDNRTITLRFSEEIDDLLPARVSIVDTLDGDTLMIFNLARSKEEPKYFNAYTEPHDSGSVYRITIAQISDTTGNTQKLTQVVELLAGTKEDTTKFELIDLAPSDSLSQFDITKRIRTEFSLPVDTSSFINRFRLITADSIKLDGDWSWTELSMGRFKPKVGFLPGKTYIYNFHTSDLKSVWGDTIAKDTTFTRTFFTLSEDEYGSVSGAITPEGNIEKSVYVLFKNLSGKRTYSGRVDKQGTFMINWVAEDKYKLGGFVDLDQNGKHSPGSLDPFVFSEPFVIQDDTLRVRKRWELSGLNLSIPGL
jgi:hypothetical protein